MVRLILLCLTLAACASYPDFDDELVSEADAAPFPRVLPINEIISQSETTQITPDFTADMETRVESLRARADRLSRPVIDRPLRQDMQQQIKDRP
ncbi:hypothetical protein [Pseudaestuariivita rosea]|uniref:hypothetical protein n=1 Tax=Pseudaestuariivita rosea TaxID=2763263 RepID=UPI001ABB3C23|nr:hypothetical protein [Pseudaestuariivita rosea]